MATVEFHGKSRPVNKRQYASLQAARGVAALMVVCHHVSVYTRSDSRCWHSPWIYERLLGTAQGAEYFFVLSGLVIFMAHWKDISKPASVLSYFWKRFRRVYPIYWIVLVPLVLQYLLRPHVGDDYQRNPWVILSGLLLVHIHSQQDNLPVAWTLFHEVLFYTVFAAFMLRRKFGYWALAAWCGLSIAMWVHPLAPYLSTYLFAPIHLLFALGILAGWIIRNVQIRGPGTMTLAGLLVCGFCVIWPGINGSSPTGIQLLAGFGAMLIYIGTASLEERGKRAVPAWMKFFGDASYSIYLVHYPVLIFLAPLAYQASMHVQVPIAVPLTAMFLAATAVGCLLHLLVERPLMAHLTKQRKLPMVPKAS